MTGPDAAPCDHDRPCICPDIPENTPTFVSQHETEEAP